MTSFIHAIAAFPFIGLVVFTAGAALAPAIAVFQGVVSACAEWNGVGYWLVRGIGLALAFYVYGFSLLVIAPLMNFILRGKLKAWRGPSVSWQILPWYIHNTLTLLVRYSFLELLTPTEFAKLYYRLMGMKIGRDVVINSTAIADPSIIHLEDQVTIGGSASLIGHYAQGGFLVIAPIRVGRGATIGMRAIIMGGTVIGEKAKILANSFVLPNTKIPPGELWGGIPAARVELPRP